MFRLTFLVWRKHCGRYRLPWRGRDFCAPRQCGRSDRRKGDLVRLYDWLAQRKITVREIDFKRQEGSSVKRISAAAGGYPGCAVG